MTIVLQLGCKCALSAKFTALALVQFATEAFFNQVVQTVAQGFQLHFVDNLVDESILQQHLGFPECL